MTASNENLPVKQNPDRELISRVAMDIGKEVVSHIRLMYPKAYASLPASGKLSVRNCVYNEIMAALEVMDAEVIERRLIDRAKFRKHQHAVYAKIRGESA